MLYYAFWTCVNEHNGASTPKCLEPTLGDWTPTLYTSVEACRKGVEEYCANYGKYDSTLVGLVWKDRQLFDEDGNLFGEIRPLRVVA